MTISLTTVHWKMSYRIIPTLYPEKNLYARITSSEDTGALRKLEELTNDRIRQAEGKFSRIRPDDDFHKSASSYNVEAAFAYSTQPSRFNDGSFGVYYTARDLTTAVAETAYHTSVFMTATNEPPMILPRRVIVSEIQGKFHDLCGRQAQFPDVYSTSSYVSSQTFALTLWKEGSNGIVYDSVRHAGGQCIAVFRPQTIHHARQERCMEYEWDGRKIARIFELREFPI